MALFKQLANIAKKPVEILKRSSFVRGSIDPCLYVKKSGKGIVYVALYVEDNLMICNIAAIDDAIEPLKSKGLVLKIVEGLLDHLTCKIKFLMIRSVLGWDNSI